MALNKTNDDALAHKLRTENSEQFLTLVRMHLSFVLNMNTDDDSAGNCDKGRRKNWNLSAMSKKAKSTAKGIMEGAPLTQEGICQVYQIVEYLSEEPNICVEGIFRRSGALSRQQELKNLLNQGLSLSLKSGQFTVHDCASVLKTFLSELPEPLLTDGYYPIYCHLSDLCKKAMNAEQEAKLVQALQLLFLLLPLENRSLLKDILQLLNLTSSYEKSNKMSADSLATLFTPHLLCHRNLAPETLHINSQTVSGILSFMIQKGLQLFSIPSNLAYDIKAYYTGKERKKILSPEKNLDESVSDNFAANTVFSFVDHEKTAQANVSNPTETALAQLYAYIQSLPESSKKRKLVKQFNKENGHGTPLQVQRVQKQNGESRSLGDSLKKRILSKNIAKTFKKYGGARAAKFPREDVICSPQCGPKSKLFCLDRNSSDESLDSNPKRDNTEKYISLNLNSHQSACTEKETENIPPIDCDDNDASELTARGSFVPDMNCSASDSRKYLTSTPAVQQAHIFGAEGFTPVDQGHKSVSPITQSTKRMTKAMQESMMTPRSRKPVLMMSGTNICKLASPDEFLRTPSVPRLSEERSEDSVDVVESSLKTVTKCKSENDVAVNRSSDLSFREYYSDPADTLTDTFREYLHSRNMLTSPVDLSFSSRLDDYDSAAELKDLCGEKLSDSLLYCLDGNRPSSAEISSENLEESPTRKRSALELSETPYEVLSPLEKVLKADGDPLGVCETSL